MNINRKNFIKVLSTSLGGYAFLPKYLHALNTSNINISGDTNLVVIQLNGGNDGLNTFVPYSDPLYKFNRPNIYVRDENLIKINKDMAWNSACKGFASLMEEGNLSIVQNVGYQNQSRSHFKGIEIWQTAPQTYETLDTGWLGRYLDLQCNGVGNVCGLNLGGNSILALDSKKSNSITINNLEFFEKILNKTFSIEDSTDENSNFEFVNNLYQDTDEALSIVRKTLDKTKNYISNYPKTDIGKKLSYIARLIKGEIETKVFYTNKGGFDTHSNQLIIQGNILTSLSEAVNYFFNDLKSAGLHKNTVVLIFSEFGRRVKENGTGTDHGAAAPVFIIGGNNKNKIIGKNPNLEDLDKIGDLKHEYDFRSIYASILQNKMNIDPKQININHSPIPNLF